MSRGDGAVSVSVQMGAAEVSSLMQDLIKLA